MLIASALGACSAGDAMDEVETDAMVAESSGDTTTSGPEPTADTGGAQTGIDVTTGSVSSGTTDDPSTSGPAEDTGEPGNPRCQDGMVDDGEQCDDGNDVNGDGCNRDCRVSGQLIWQTTFGSGLGQVDQAFDVHPTGEGGAFVAGYIAADETGARDGWLARYDAEGMIAWQHTLVGPGGGNDEIRAVAQDADGNVFAAGYTSGPKGQGLDAFVARYDAEGVEVWSTRFNGPDSRTDVFDAMTIDADGNLVVGGYSQSTVSSNDVFLRKLDPADGSPLWSRVFPGPNGGADLVWDVGVSPAGHIYAAGYQEGPAGEGRNAWLAKYDTDGNEIWSRSFNGPESLDDQLIGLAVVGEDDVVVSGHENGAEYPWRAIVRRYDGLGMIVWTDRYAGGTGEGAHAFGMSADPDDGQLIMTGGERIDGVRHLLVRKYDPEGGELWTSIIPGGATGPDYGREVAVDANGEVWIAGTLDTGLDVRDVWVGRFTP